MQKSINKNIINTKCLVPQLDDEFVAFNLDDFVTNPVANIRIKKGLTQKQLATKMEVSQAYISKLEQQSNISDKTLFKIKNI